MSEQTINTIAAQIQQLANLHTVRLINTGDRVVDGALTVIVNSLLAILGAFMYTRLMALLRAYRKRYITKELIETDEPTNIDINNFDYTKYPLTDIKKYIYTLKLQPVPGTYLHMELVAKWCAHTYKSLHVYKSIQVQSYHVAQKHLLISNSDNDSYFMPIWKYKKNADADADADAKYEYIWLADCTLYSNNHLELVKCLDVISGYSNELNALANATLIKPVVARKIREIGVSTCTTLGDAKLNRTLDRMYFDEKEALIRVLDKFKNNAMYPEGLALDNKLGILLHGPPGTGKTGCITAIANYLERDILLVNSLCHDLDTLFHNINSKKDTHIIVFDEFDHILAKQQKDNSTEASYKELLFIADNADERKKIIEQMAQNKKQDDVGQMLRFLDGVEDNSGRIIIATTNNPDKINKLFLRPGRFDMKLELGYCSPQMFHDIVKCVYLKHTAADVSKTQLYELLQKNISPLVLINTLLQTSSLEECIKTLC